MGILHRLSTLIKSNLNSTLDKMSDPGKQIDQLVIEMEDSQKKARVEVQATLAVEKRLRQRCEALLKSGREWEERATRAVQAGDDGLAKEALKRKAGVEAELKEAAVALEDQRAHVDELTAALKALDARVKEVKLRKETIKAQARAQKSREAGTGSHSAFDRFEQLSTGIDVKEAEVALDDELAAARHEDVASRDVEKRLDELSKSSDLDDRLAALKAKIEKKE